MHAKYQIKNERSQEKNNATQTCRATEIMQLPYQRRLPIKWIMLTSSILYQATIKCSNSKYEQKWYKGFCETTTFKKRYANHKKPFNLI